MCPSQDHFLFLALLIISYDFRPLPDDDPDVGPSVLVCDIEHSSYISFIKCSFL